MDCGAKWTMLESGTVFCTEEWKGTHLAVLPYGELLNFTAHSGCFSFTLSFTEGYSNRVKAGGLASV